MKIETNEPCRDAYYTEAMNISWQQKSLYRKPDAKIMETNRDLRNYTIFSALLVLFTAAAGFFSHFPPFWIVMTTLAAVLTLYGLLLMRNYSRIMKTVRNGFSPSVLTLDENGLTLVREGKMDIRESWDQIAAVRVFHECLCFIPKTEMNILVMTDICHKKEVLDTLQAENVPVQVIEGK